MGISDQIYLIDHNLWSNIIFSCYWSFVINHIKSKLLNCIKAMKSIRLYWTKCLNNGHIICPGYDTKLASPRKNIIVNIWAHFWFAAVLVRVDGTTTSLVVWWLRGWGFYGSSSEFSLRCSRVSNWFDACDWELG